MVVGAWFPGIDGPGNRAAGSVGLIKEIVVTDGLLQPLAFRRILGVSVWYPTGPTGTLHHRVRVL